MQLADYLKQSPRGEAARIARELGVPPSNVSEYARLVRYVPPDKAPALERETCFQVLREEMFMSIDWRKVWPDLVPLRRLESVAVA